MKFLGKKWKLVTIAFFVICYLVLMVAMKKPLSTLLLCYAGFVVLTMILFLGSSIGFIGLILQFALKKDAAAEPFYRLAYRLGSNHVNVLTSYGLILLKESKIDEALEVFHKTLELKPYFLIDKIVKCNVAICYWKQNKIDEAIAMYEKIFDDFALNQDNDEDDTAEENEIKAIAVDNEKAEAEALEDKPEIDITTNTYIYSQDYTTLGYLYLLREDYEKAILNSKKALILTENYAPALDNLGQIYYQMANYDMSIEYLKKALDINPKMADSNYYMGLVMEKKSDMEQAKKYYEIASTCKVNALNTVTDEDIERKKKQFRIGM